MNCLYMCISVSHMMHIYFVFHFLFRLLILVTLTAHVMYQDMYGYSMAGTSSTGGQKQ